MMSEPENDKGRAAMRWILAAFYAAAGIAHLWAPEKLLAITPSWVPFPSQVIFITGICEILGAAALVTRPLRRWAGIALAAYAICVWPANFKHAIDGIDLPYIASSWLLSRTAAGVSAGPDLVGAVLFRCDRLAVAAAITRPSRGRVKKGRAQSPLSRLPTCFCV